MKLPKTNKVTVITWLSLGLLGFLIDYFLVKPAMSDWPQSATFSDDLMYGVYKLAVAEILLVPAITVALLALLRATKDKKTRWSIVHLSGLIILFLLVVYFALPILLPARGL